ncbi:hypothetical protein ACXN5S_07530 [Pseudoroseicyclus sp. H15]
MVKTLFLIGLVLVLIGLAPIASVALASLLADRAGCELHEGYANACIIAGKDRGDMLYTMFVAGWLMLMTIPLGFIGLVLLAVSGGVALWRRRA